MARAISKDKIGLCEKGHPDRLLSKTRFLFQRPCSIALPIMSELVTSRVNLAHDSHLIAVLNSRWNVNVQ